MEIGEADSPLHLIYLTIFILFCFLFLVLFVFPLCLAFPIWIMHFFLFLFEYPDYAFFCFIFYRVLDAVCVPFLILPDFRFKT